MNDRFYPELVNAGKPPQDEIIALIEALGRFRGTEGFTEQEAVKLVQDYQEKRVGFVLYVLVLNGYFDANVDPDGHILIGPKKGGE